MTNSRTCDALIIGGGSAGLRAAIEAHDAGAVMQNRQRYFQLVKSLVYLRVTFTKYLYCLLLQSSHSPEMGLGLCLIIHLRTLV